MGNGSQWMNTPLPFSVGQIVQRHSLHCPSHHQAPAASRKKPLLHAGSLHLCFIFLQSSTSDPEIPSPPLRKIYSCKPLTSALFSGIWLLNCPRSLNFHEEFVFINPSCLILVYLFDKYVCNTCTMYSSKDYKILTHLVPQKPEEGAIIITILQMKT